MYNKMKSSEKWVYFYRRLTYVFLVFLLFGIFIMFMLNSMDGLNVNNVIAMLLIFLGILMLVSVFNLFYPANLLSSKVQITDGYIFERFHRRENDGTGYRFSATAKTLDGSKTTPRKTIPYDFRHGQIPVKIVIYKNKARDFIITEESYEYVDKHRGEIEKKKDKITSIIGIVLTIIFIIEVIVVFLK